MKRVSIFILGLLLSAATSSYAQQTPAIPYAPKTEEDLAKDKALREVAKEAAREALREDAARKATPAKVASTTTTTTTASECPPPVTPAKKKKPDCTPKPKPKPTPKPAPKPEAKKCPEQKPCPKCEPEVKIKTVTVEKEKVVYRDRTVTIDNAPKNTLNLLVGIGPHGLVTDYYETKDRQDEYAVRKEKDKSKGGLIGLEYQYRVSPSYSVGGLILSNETVMASGGIHW
jgi:outer membrane biosynthesis protein TonB